MTSMETPPPMNPETFRALKLPEQKRYIQQHIVTINPKDAEHGCGDDREILYIVKNNSGEQRGKPQAPQLATQNFGGSIGEATVYMAYQWAKGNQVTLEAALAHTITELTGAGYDVGGHREAEPHDGSGCGYADNNLLIIHRRPTLDVSEESPATNRVMQTYRSISEAVENKKIVIPSGENLMSLLEAGDSTTQYLVGEHNANGFVIVRARDKTLDTNGIHADSGVGLFSIDEYDALDRAEAIGVPRDFAEAAYHIDWAATMHVLALDANPNLPTFTFEENDLQPSADAPLVGV